MAGEQSRNIRLFVDADGRLTDLLSRLNIETTEVGPDRDFDAGGPRGFGFVEMSDVVADKTDIAADAATARLRVKARKSGKQASARAPSEEEAILSAVKLSPMSGKQASPGALAASRRDFIERYVKARMSGKPESVRGARPGKRRDVVSAKLRGHAVETFGSEQTARKWLSSECGALNNRTPLQVIQGEGNEAEVERVLDCIDYGMLA